MPYKIDSKVPIHFENALLVSEKHFPLPTSARELWPWHGACPALSQTATPGTSRSVLSVLYATFPLCWTCSSPTAGGRSKFFKSNAKGGNWLEWKEHSCRSENTITNYCLLASVSLSIKWIRQYPSG